MQKLTIKVGGHTNLLDMSDLFYHGTSQSNGNNVSIRCPHCGNTGVFAPRSGLGGDVSHRFAKLNGTDALVSIYMGVRYCPNDACLSPVFVIAQGTVPLATFPPRSIDFDATNLPHGVQDSLAEAIRCHANGCFRAGAIMVRRTLEEVCADKGATGKDLQKRIEALKDKVTLPQALFDAMTGLRLLGNDAAHIEATVYNGIGAQEVELAIEFAKEIVKAVYQYEDLLARLRSLQNNAA